MGFDPGRHGQSACIAALLDVLVVLGVLAVARPARAEETPLVLVGGLFESASVTIAPVVVLRAPLGEDQSVTASQVGWTTGLAADIALDRHWSWSSSVAFTPIRAHLSHNVYDTHGHELLDGEFDDTALRVASGAAWRWREGSLMAQAVVGKEWLSRLPAGLSNDFRRPFAGVEAAWKIEALRSEELLSGRIDGARLRLRAEALAGQRQWVDADAALSLGRKAGPFFFRLEAAAYAVTIDHPVTDVTIGGSWDMLGGWALMGHPLGAFRLARAASATAGLDVRALGPLELGVRSSLLAGALELHEGIAVLAHGTVSGIYLFGGAALPDVFVARADILRIGVFAGLSGALLFAP
jgi:hypothetical protein